MTAPPQFAATLTTVRDTKVAIREGCQEILKQLNGTPDLVLIFFSLDHAPEAEALASVACAALQTKNVIGCTGEAIAGTGREIEDGPALSIWAARWPGVSQQIMHLEFDRTPDGGVLNGWPEGFGDNLAPDAFLLLLADPFFFPADLLLERLNEDHPGLRVIGGMASGGHQPGINRLICGEKVYREGALAVLVQGPVKLRTVVSQGCRPIGKPFVVTKSDRNVLLELGGRPALLQLKEIFDELPSGEQALVQAGLHLGRVVSEYQDRFEQGDFLIRNVVGIDPNQGAIAVGDFIRVGQTVQFHVRDEDSADAELKQMIAQARAAGLDRNAGALLFTCNGRGSRLFRTPNHDAGCVAAGLGKIPLAGFFAQGEIGPVGGKNFLHGFTASIAIFEPK